MSSNPELSGKPLFSNTDFPALSDVDAVVETLQESSKREPAVTKQDDDSVVIDIEPAPPGIASDNQIFPEEQDDDDGFESAIASGAFDEPDVSPLSLSSSKLSEDKTELRCNEMLAAVRRFQPDDRMFPDVKASEFHTLAVKLSENYTPGDRFEPNPSTFSATWGDDYVPLPCHEKAQLRTKKKVDVDASGDVLDSPVFTEVSIPLWERVKEALQKPLTSCLDIANAIRSYHRFSGELTVLSHAVEKLMTQEERKDFFENTLPGMVDLCLSLPTVVTCSVPFLVKFSNHSITFSQKQVACMLANAFFCTYPKRFGYERDFPSITFIPLLTGADDPNPPQIFGDRNRFLCKANKVLCILNYFRRVVKEMPQGLITYTRRSIRTSRSPAWGKSGKPLKQIIPLCRGTIEDEGKRMVQIDFADMYVGGGVLGNGCVQEEILFLLYPEMILSRLFMERIAACESFSVTGCERFNRYTGYANSFRFEGDFTDCIPYCQKGRKCTQIVGIDAIPMRKHVDQFHPDTILRELNKAYIGFSNPLSDSLDVAIATGRWGCGAFKGDVYLKALIQLMAASQSDRPIVFFTFNDPKLQRELLDIYEVLANKTVGEVMSLLSQYNKVFCSQGNPSMNLYQFLTVHVPKSRAPISTPVSATDENPDSFSSLDDTEFPSLSSSLTASRNRGPSSKSVVQRTIPKRDWLGKLEATTKSINRKKDRPETSSSSTGLTDGEILAAMNADDINAGQDAKSDFTMDQVLTEETHGKTEVLITGTRSLKRPLPGADDSEDKIESPEPPKINADPPPKRQMTLEDFYKST